MRVPTLLVAIVMAQAAVASSPSMDANRLEAMRASDLEVLLSLRQHGDVSSIVRPIDVRFVGAKAAIIALEKDAAALGWTVIGRETMEDGNEALDVQRSQTTDEAAIQKLTQDALKIEASYDVQYDGWGTLATSR